MARKAVKSLSRYPQSRRNLSPNSAFRPSEGLAGSPAFGSRASSFIASSDSLASASSRSSSSIRPPPRRPPGPPPSGSSWRSRRPCAPRSRRGSPTRPPRRRAASAGRMPLRTSATASRLVASGRRLCPARPRRPRARLSGTPGSPRSARRRQSLGLSLQGFPGIREKAAAVSPLAARSASILSLSSFE